MDTNGALVIDMRKPGWASAPALVSDVVTEPPQSIKIDAQNAATPSAEEAQILLALTRHAAANNIPISIEGVDGALRAEMGRIGFETVFPAEGDATP
ncbi:MAG: hypothetical protein AAGA70_14940 [Pseudomonadota bacterium]